MSTLRVCRPRAFRPYLSTRYQCLRRAESTIPPPGQSTAPTLTPPNQKSSGGYRTPVIFGVLSLTLGLLTGNLVSHTIAPPPLPEPGTREDGILVADLNKRIDEEFKVKVLRGKCLGVAKQLKGAEGGWVEIVSNPTEETVTGADTLLHQQRGARGLGVQRVFWNRSEHMLVAIVWFGPGLSGWPGVTHGGVIATQFSEKMVLAEALAEGQNSDFSAAAVPQRMPGTGNHAKMLAPANKPDEPAQMSLNYVKPTLANNFYVIRISPSLPLDQDPEHIVPAEPMGGHEYEATLETMDAKITAKGKARFAPSTRLQRVEEQVTQAAKSTYTDFKHWLWPSRQQSSQMS